MHGLTVETKHQVKLEWSADRWELFSDMPGAEAAAKELNATFVKTVNAGADRRTVSKAMGAVMRKHSDLGAQDSEPLYHLDCLLERLFPNG